MKAHQRIIREQKQFTDSGGLFGYPQNVDIKTAIVKETDFNTASKIIYQYEWLGTMPTFCTHYFGIYFEGICGGVVIYGISLPKSVLDGVVGKKYGDKVRVLSRGACVWWAHPHSASKLIGESLKILKKQGYKAVVAFCDTRAGEIGTIYQACNFIYIGESKGGLEYFIEGKWRTGKGAGNYAHKKRNLGDYKQRNRSTKYKYVYIMGNKTENHEMLEYLKDKISPYPKRKD